MVNQQAQTMMTKDWLARMEQEEVELKTKVKRMETYINNAFPSSIKELQVTQSPNQIQIEQLLLQSLSLHSLSRQPASVFI